MVQAWFTGLNPVLGGRPWLGCCARPTCTRPVRRCWPRPAPRRRWLTRPLTSRPPPSIAARWPAPTPTASWCTGSAPWKAWAWTPWQYGHRRVLRWPVGRPGRAVAHPVRRWQPVGLLACRSWPCSGPSRSCPPSSTASSNRRRTRRNTRRSGWAAAPGVPGAPPPCAFGMPTWIVRAIRLAEHRRLTQHLAAWLDEQTVPEGSPLAGVQFASRHGGELALWVVFERVDDTSALTSCTTAPARCSIRTIPSSLRPAAASTDLDRLTSTRSHSRSCLPRSLQGHWTCGGAGRATAGTRG